MRPPSPSCHRRTYLIKRNVLVVVVAGDGAEARQALAGHLQPLLLLADRRVQQRPPTRGERHLLGPRGGLVQDAGGARMQAPVQGGVARPGLRVQGALQGLQQAPAVAQVDEELAVFLHLQIRQVINTTANDRTHAHANGFYAY